jgi:hypothetical protein
MAEVGMKFEIRNLKLGIALSLLAIKVCTAQVTEYPLNKNAAIISYRLQHKDDMRQTASAADTLSLPFMDDFSQEGIYPTSDLWLDSGAFVNSTFCDNPPTYGVATFDGIDKNGHRYSASSTRQYCDTMTSKPIRLAFAQADTTVWLSFYYQPQGLGIAPFSADTLLLQFKDTANHWTRVWYKNGTTKQPFARVNIHVSDLKYCFDGFQFRFVNYGPPNANTDHWNVDYIYLNNYRSSNDSITDVGMVNKPVSVLSEFTSMPWPHYSSSILSKASVSDSARNINYGPTTVQYYYSIYDEAGSLLLRDSMNDGSSYSGKVSSFTHSLNGFTFPHTSTDSATFLIKDSLANNGTLNLNNDISLYRQNFFNYYSYDDGTAELNSGLSGSNLKWAMQFDVKMRDTLRGVQIYFNPTSLDVSSQQIDITLWDNINVSTNTEHVVYTMINQVPDTVDSINGFTTYRFPVPQVVGPGNIWVGFVQSNNVLIGLGVDKNTDSHSKMFYAANGQWNQYTFSSTWMIRPYFGKYVSLVNVNDLISDENFFTVYPNPTSDKLHFSFHENTGIYQNLQYELTDITGRIVTQGVLAADEVDISILNPGIYFARVKDHGNNVNSPAKKIVVCR